jgi:hypothetical protein
LARATKPPPTNGAEVRILTELGEHTAHRVALLEAEHEQTRMAIEAMRREAERLLLRLIELERKLQQIGEVCK